MLPARRVARAIAATRGEAPGTRPPISGALARRFASSDASGEQVVDVCVVCGLVDFLADVRDPGFVFYAARKPVAWTEDE